MTNLHCLVITKPLICHSLIWRTQNKPTVWAYHTGFQLSRYISLVLPSNLGTLDPRHRTLTTLACSRLSDSGEDAKVKGTRKVGGAGKKGKKEGKAPPLPSLFPFYFRVRSFSIQRTRQSRSPEQAMTTLDPRPKTPLNLIFVVIGYDFVVILPQDFPRHEGYDEEQIY